MSSVKLIKNEKKSKFLKKFKVEFDIVDFDDGQIKSLIKDLRSCSANWTPLKDLANIIENK